MENTQNHLWWKHWSINISSIFRLWVWWWQGRQRMTTYPFPLAIPEKGSGQNHPCSYYWRKCMRKRGPGVLPLGTTAQSLGLLALSSLWTNGNTWKAFSDILQILSKSAAQPALCRWWLCSHGGITQHPTFSKLSSSFHWVPLILVLFRDLGLWFKFYPLLLPWLFLDFKICGSHRKFQIPWLNPVSSAMDPVSRAFQCCEPVSWTASAVLIPNFSPCNSKY